MSELEATGQALAIRPLLWLDLTPANASLIRARLDGQAYTAIAETLGAGQRWTPPLVKRYEHAICRTILNHQEIMVILDRVGRGARYAQGKR
jgi:hypothetical protein